MNRDAIPTYRPRPRSTYIDTRQSDPGGVALVCFALAALVYADVTLPDSLILAAFEAMRGWLR